MLYYLVKLLLSALIIVVVSEISKRFSFIGSLIASLPLTSLLAIIWLYIDTKSVEKVGALAEGIFWLVLPSLPMFLLLPYLLRKGLNFWGSMGASVLLTFVLYLLMSWVVRRYGIIV